MRKDAFKKIIKEAVKEAIREELTTTLMEALLRTKDVTPSYSKSPSKPINESMGITDIKADIRNNYPTPKFEKDREISLTSNDVPTFNPRAASGMATAGEGTSLPGGDVSMNQIASLLNK